MRIHLARWLLNPGRLPIENGGVVTFGGKIIAAGKRAELCRDFHGKVVDHGDAILCPPLVNAHCHLELSSLAYRLDEAQNGAKPGSFTSWVRALIALRQEEQEDESGNAVENAVFQMLDNGIAVLGDVGNSTAVPDFVKKSGKLWPFAGIFFHEIIAPLERLSPQLPTTKKTRLSSKVSPPFIKALSAHAPYTVSPSALKALNRWSADAGTPFCIHAAESIDETEFMKHGRGAIRELMEEKGHWPLDWKIPGTTTVKYLEGLCCLHKKTLLIHCVQAESDDLDIIAAHGASVCLCPESNRFIGVGTAPSYEMYKKGINLALGTDSLASNRRLSIFSEMARLASDSPSLPMEAIFQAATIGGARALGIESDYGTLEPGKQAVIMVVRGECRSADEALEFVVREAAGDRVTKSLIDS